MGWRNRFFSSAESAEDWGLCSLIGHQTHCWSDSRCASGFFDSSFASVSISEFRIVGNCLGSQFPQSGLLFLATDESVCVCVTACANQRSLQRERIKCVYLPNARDTSEKLLSKTCNCVVSIFTVQLWPSSSKSEPIITLQIFIGAWLAR